MRVLLAAALLLGCAHPPAAPPELPEDEGRSIVEQAQAAIDAGQPADAIPPLRALLAAAPADAHARGVLAHALLATDDLPASRASARTALAFDPTLAAVAWNLACAYARAGNADLAIPWLQRALATGGWEPQEVAADPDLARLAEDHRLAVYFATGVLSRAEEDSVVLLDRDRGQTGAPARLSVALMQLNKPLLSPADATLAVAGGAVAPVAVVERLETFSRGSAGGREYSQRTVHFTIVPLVAGVLQLGPFGVASDTGRSVTTPVLLPVEGDAVAPPTGAADASWFGFPSHQDRPAIDALTDAGVEPLIVPEDAAPTVPPFVPIPGGAARLLRFRALTPELPEWVPPRPPGTRRSALVQRSTEGWSWVLDVRPDP